MIQPLATTELVEKLRGLFPAKPARGMTQREIDFMVGQQEVIDYLEVLAGEEAQAFDPEAP